MEPHLAKPSASRLRLTDLPTAKPTAFDLTLDATARAGLAQDLGIVAVRKLRFAGQIAPLGATDWQLTATLGATVVQDCVITLEPVTTRIDDPVTRTYVADLPEPDAAEVEMPEDDSLDPLPEHVDLHDCLLYTSPSPRDRTRSRMPSSA